MFGFIQQMGWVAWLVIAVIIIAVVGLFNRYLKNNNKRITPDEITFGPLSVKITDVPVESIQFLSQPRDISGRPAILPDILVKVYDGNNKALSGKKVIIELESHSGTDILRGLLEKQSNKDGKVVFSGLKISRSGQYNLIAKSEGRFAMSASFDISPPGLDTDFNSKKYGSVEYKDSLARKLSLSKAQNEVVRMDREDI